MKTQPDNGAAPAESAALRSIAELHALKVPGRSCGTCSMCCKVFDVPWVDNKPKGQWCKHCRPGRGCAIWDSRPERCQDYFCQWFFAPGLGDDWRPDVARFLLNLSSNEFWLEIVVDPAQPNAWRREPYGSYLRSVADMRMRQGKGLLLHVGDKRAIVTPTEEVDISQFGTEAVFEFRVDGPAHAPVYRINVVQTHASANASGNAMREAV
jgi:hypothetical protein